MRRDTFWFALASAALMTAACSDESGFKSTGGTDSDSDCDSDTDVDSDSDSDSDTDTGLDCDDGTGDCNGDPEDGCETDLTSDDEHCGACDHDCLGGNCVNSACQPVQVADPQGSSLSPWNGFLSLGPDDVYFGYAGTNFGGFAMAAKDGTSAACIACDEGTPRESTTSASYVFWVDIGVDELRRAPLDGSSFTTLWSGQVGTPVAVDTGYIYWYADGASAVMRADHDGGGATQVATGQNNVGSLAAEGGFVYWSTASAIFELEVGVGSPTPLVQGLTSPRSVVVDDDYAYFATGQWGVDEAVRRVPRGGGAAELLTDTGGAYVIALDATHVYAAANHDGVIFRIPKDGGTPEVLATGQPFPFDIAVDDEAVYWSSETDAAVAKVAK